MKITTRLTISSAAFLVPIAVMIYFVISLSNTSIQSARNELRGTACLKPIAGLLQRIPRHLKATLDYTSGDSSRPDEEIEQLFNELKREFSSGSNDDIIASITTIQDLLKSINSGSLEETLETYMKITRSIGELITYTGEFYGLVADPEMNSYYLVDISLNSLPQAQEHFLRVENTLRLANSRKDIEACLTLLKEIDYLKAIANLETATRQYRNSPTGLNSPEAKEILFRLSNYRTSIDQLIVFLEKTVNTDNPEQNFPTIMNQLVKVNEDTFLLWNTTVNQLDVLLHNRISAFYVSLIRSLIIAVLASALAFFIIIVTNISISQSAARLQRLFISLQNNDLSLNLEVDSHDEFGELMIAFNRFLEKLRTAFMSFSQHASMVSTSVYDLSASAKEISTTANEQSTSVAEIVSTMEDNKNLSEQVAVKTAEVADLMTQTQKLSRHGVELRDANQDMMQDIRDQNAKIIEEIMNLADMLNRIDEIIAIIDVIADQTKLIAFNASLEASSSGEEGARFAVVAGEIRRFADSVAESTSEIKEKIEEVQNASRMLIEEANQGSEQIAFGYERMVEQKTVFENIVEVSQNVATRSQQISNLSKQQELASSQVFLALKEISAGVQQFVIATSSTSKTADNLNAMSVELRETVDKYQTGKNIP
jgi:methyl-accepting chemotaxis protein